MSQAKVDRYKASKKNRQQEIKKAKQQQMLGKLVGIVIVIGVVAWLGYSGYRVYDNNRPINTVSVDYSAITEYTSGLY